MTNNGSLSLLEQLKAHAASQGITLPVFSDAARELQRAGNSDAYDMGTIERAVESDAALAAEVLRAAIARLAGLPHPIRAAERRKGRRSPPYVGKRVFAHIPEFKIRNNLGGVAGKHLARGGNIE